VIVKPGEQCFALNVQRNAFEIGKGKGQLLVIVWEFRVHASRASEFEQHYGPEGTWARVFRKAEGYRGTELVRDTSDGTRYLTLDRWESLADYERFKREFAAEYEKIDAGFESLTANEQLLGRFETIG